jgi:hypothetical protein
MLKGNDTESCCTTLDVSSVVPFASSRSTQVQSERPIIRKNYRENRVLHSSGSVVQHILQHPHLAIRDFANNAINLDVARLYKSLAILRLPP